MAEASSSTMQNSTKFWRSNGKESHCKKENEDIISRLPDEVLSHILSFLPTKYAVGTSILSNRWKYLWTLVPNLDFDDYLIIDRKKVQQGVDLKGIFMKFVDRVLNLHGAPCIPKFHLKLRSNGYDSSHVNAWISAACNRNVVELGIRNEWIPGTVELPRCVLSHEKLVVLKLDEKIELNLPDAVFFPSLKGLHLHSLSSLDEASVRKLISGSPALQELVIHKHYSDNDVHFLHVESSSLKSLTISMSTDPEFRKEHYYRVDVDAPNLEFLKIIDLVSEEFNLIQLTSLVEAQIDIGFQFYMDEEYYQYVSKTVQILRQISNVKVLRLFQLILKISPDVAVEELPSFGNLPTFHNLTHLELRGGGIDETQLLILSDILKYTPNLKVFYLYVGSKEWMWRAPQSVPRCLLFCLEVIELDLSEWNLAEMEMAEYFLKNAMVLKNMTIVSRTIFSDEDIRKKLLMFPWGSSSCQIAFSRSYSQGYFNGISYSSLWRIPADY